MVGSIVFVRLVFTYVNEIIVLHQITTMLANARGTMIRIIPC